MSTKQSGIFTNKRSQKVKGVVFWTLGLCLTLVVTLPYALFAFSQAWKVVGLVCATIFLPLAIPAYPFVVAAYSLGNWIVVVRDFLIVGVNFALLITAWTITNHRYLKPTATISLRQTLLVRLVHVKDFYVWLLLTWAEFVAFFLLYVFSILFIFLGTLRQLVYEISLKSRMWSKDHATFFRGLLFMFYLQIAIVIPGLTYQYFGKDRLIDGIAAAAVLLVFMALQFQKMTPPYFVPTFVDSQGTLIGYKRHDLKAKASTPIWLFLRITNLGITSFKDCSLEVTFPEGFEILDDPDLYKKADFYKRFSVRQNKRIIEFLPRENYLTFAPCSHLIFPIFVRTPAEPSDYQIITKLASESAWGEHSEPLRIVISRSDG